MSSICPTCGTSCATWRRHLQNAAPAQAEGAELERWGIKYQGPREPHCLPMADGYWTPWHLAQAEIASLRDKESASNKALVAANISLTKRADEAEIEIASLRERLAEALKLLREIDRHGVLSMATQKGAGQFVLTTPPSPPQAEAAAEPKGQPLPAPPETAK